MSLNATGNGERGVVLPVSAVVLVSLLLMSAMVLDIGRLSLERRRDQGAVDVAAIAGAMHRTSEPVLVEAVRDSLDRNLPNSITTASLDTCGADTLPPGFTAYPSANCIAHDTSWTQLRVRVPTQSFRTAFAGLAGLTELEHTAVAQVYDRRNGMVLPFIVSASAGNYECLKVGAGNVPDVRCSGSTSGNFGVATFGLWGNRQMGTTTDCSGTGDQFMVNVAQGIDHDLSRWGDDPHTSTDVIDTASCGSTPFPNSMMTTTGNTPERLGAAVFGPDTFPDGGPSRLRRVSGMSWFPTTTFDGAVVDDTPLWDFIPPSLGAADDVPASCLKSQFIGDAGGLNEDSDGYMTALPLAVANHLLLVPRSDRMIKLLERCLVHYEGQSWDDHGSFLPAEAPTGCTGSCDDPVFGLDSAQEVEDIIDLQASPRFGYVPQLTNGSIPEGNSLVRIDRFRAVFLQRTYGGNCSTSGCPVTWDPGVGFSTTSTTDKASALTAFILPPGILPNGLADDGAHDRYGANRFVQLTR